MSDFVSDGQPMETPIAAASQGYATAPPSFARAFGAMYHDSSTLEALQRAAARGEMAGASDFDSGVARYGYFESGQANLDAQNGVKPPAPVASPMLSAAEANKRYAPQGTTITSAPMPEAIAQMVGKEKAAELDRESVLSRFDNAHSWPVNFGMGMAAFLLDPLNFSTMFAPGAGEESVLNAAGRVGLGSGFLARTGARVVAGGIGGAVAQAPLSALRYGLGREEASDYGLRQALTDTLYSAAGGAIVHAGLGAAGDAIQGLRARATIEAPAPVKDAAMRSAISQVIDGRAIDVMPVVDENEMRRASARDALAAEHAGATAELARLPQGDAGAADRLTRLAAVESGLRDETISPEDRRTLSQRRDELLTDTTPEALAEAAAPIAQRRALENRIASLADQIARSDAAAASARADQTLRAPLVDPAAIADLQRRLYANGFAPGIPQPEFDTMREQIYGEKSSGASASVAPAGQAAERGGSQSAASAAEPADELAALEKRHAAALKENGGKIAPEDKAELDRTEKAMASAALHEQAAAQAAQCLTEAGV